MIDISCDIPPVTTSYILLAVVQSIQIKGTYKSCGNSNHIKLVVSTISKSNTSLGKLLDGVVLDIHNIHVGSVKLLVVVVLKTRTLDAKVMRHLDRSQEIPLSGVTNAGARLLEPEVVRLLVGFWVEEVVLVQGDPVAEATVGPDLFVEGVSLLGGVVECVLLVPVVVEPGEAGLTELEKLGVPLLLALLLFDGELSSTHGDSQVGSSLEDLDFAGDRTPGLGYLHPRSSGADDGAALVLDVDFIVGPEGRVMNDALELVHTGPVGDIALGGEAGSKDEVLCLCGAAIFGLDAPPTGVCVKLCADDDGVEGAVLLDIEDLVDVIKVCAELIVGGIVARPVPSLPSLWEAELVLWDFRIHTCSGIAVPAP